MEKAKQKHKELDEVETNIESVKMIQNVYIIHMIIVVICILIIIPILKMNSKVKDELDKDIEKVSNQKKQIEEEFKEKKEVLDSFKLQDDLNK